MKLFIMLFSISVITVICGCADSTNTLVNSGKNEIHQSDGGFDTLDLNFDQCVPGGLTESEIADYVDLGYQLDTLDAARLFLVDFNNASTGPYQNIGYVPAGSIMLINPNTDPPTGLFKLCGNHWLEQED